MLIKAIKTFSGQYGLVRAGTIQDFDEKYAKDMIAKKNAVKSEGVAPEKKGALPGPPRTAGGNVISPAARKGGKGKQSSVLLPDRASRKKTLSTAGEKPAL